MKRKTVSGIMLTLLLMGMLMLAFDIQPAKAGGTIYIKTDGSVDPPDAPISSADNVTYTFTDNIYGGIVVERSNIIIDGDGYTLRDAYEGVRLSSIGNVTVKRTNIKRCTFGIITRRGESSNNTVSGNNITNSGGAGIYFDDSSNNSISGNNITGGISLEAGIWLEGGSYNIISGNNIANNNIGIWLDYSSNNVISGNNIANNSESGIYAPGSSNNIIYHNNVINNTRQVESNLLNTWDDGYPSGGNYWSDHNPPDVYSGPYQNETGRDGIGDEPYIIGGNKSDRYPLVYPYGYVPSPDLTGDCIVDIEDVTICALVLWSQPGDPSWNPIVDLNNDGTIDIIDLVLIAIHFGETL